MLAPVKQVSSDAMVHSESTKTENQTLVQSFCYANLYHTAQAQLTFKDFFNI
jgi:hypothetical protein